jgi:hypothetical protein
VETEDGATDIVLVDGDQLSLALDDIRTGARGEGLDIRTQTLQPAEVRWYAEQALDAAEADDPGWLVEMVSRMSYEDEQDGPSLGALAVLARRRLADLPKARKPAGARSLPYPDDAQDDAALSVLTELFLRNNGIDRFGDLPFGQPAPAKLPRKRKKSD